MQNRNLNGMQGHGEKRRRGIEHIEKVPLKREFLNDIVKFKLMLIV